MPISKELKQHRRQLHEAIQTIRETEFVLKGKLPDKVQKVLRQVQDALMPKHKASIPRGTLIKGSMSSRIVTALQDHGPMTTTEIKNELGIVGDANLLLRNASKSGNVIRSKRPSDNRYGYVNVWHLPDQDPGKCETDSLPMAKPARIDWILKYLHKFGRTASNCPTFKARYSEATKVTHYLATDLTEMARQGLVSRVQVGASEWEHAQSGSGWVYFYKIATEGCIRLNIIQTKEDASIEP